MIPMEAQVEMPVTHDEIQVTAKPRRRTYTAEYKRRILKEADACRTPGAVGALLRREGLYSSHLVEWRRARARGELTALTPKKRGRKPRPVDPRDRKIAELERQLAELKLHVLPGGRDAGIEGSFSSAHYFASRLSPAGSDWPHVGQRSIPMAAPPEDARRIQGTEISHKGRAQLEEKLKGERDREIRAALERNRPKLEAELVAKLMPKGKSGSKKGTPGGDRERS